VGYYYRNCRTNHTRMPLTGDALAYPVDIGTLAQANVYVNGLVVLQVLVLQGRSTVPNRDRLRYPRSRMIRNAAAINASSAAR
jgi:hypothetical protein